MPGRTKLGLEKTTPSGSKCRVPAAPITGPLKSPNSRREAGSVRGKCERVHNPRSLLRKWRRIDGLVLPVPLVRLGRLVIRITLPSLGVLSNPPGRVKLGNETLDYFRFAIGP